MKQINALKNMLWALAIILCLAGLLIALLFAAFTHYSGPKERGGVQLGAAPAEQPQQVEPSAATVSAARSGVLAETDDGGQGYLDGLTFLVDSTMIGLRDYGLLSGGVETNQVWGGQSGSIPADSLGSFNIRYPNDGSVISPIDAAMVAKPARLVLCLGADGLSQTSEQQFKDGYLSLIRELQRVSPDTKLILCTLPSVSDAYQGSDGLSPTRLSEANVWIRSICEQTGLPYAEIADALNNSDDGLLLGTYAAANGKTLNAAGLNVVLHYLRTHTV